MSYGILVRNPSGHILISSEIESLHYAGLASYAGLVSSGLTEFPDYANDNGLQTLSGRHIHRFVIACPTTPLMFIRPSAPDFFHGILRQWNEGGYWWVDIIQGGPYPSTPTVLAFAAPSGMPGNGEQYGIVTRLPSGKVAFDSRLNPLAINYAAAVMPPTSPCDGGFPTQSGGYPWNDANLDFDFRCNNSFSRSYWQGGSNLMFSAPSVAQAVYSRIKNGFKSSSDGYSDQDHWSTAIWWAMYHSAYRVGNGYIDAGWCVYAAGYKFFSYFEDGGWFGGDGGSMESGTQPYSDKTINLSPNVIIVADASIYL